MSTEYVQSVERGLRVIQAFSRESPRLSYADAARRTGLSRATARRLLLTLRELGYARQDGPFFELTPKVLDIGYAYLSSLDFARMAQFDMERLVEQTHESSSAAVLDGAEIVYVARVPVTDRNRIMTISLGIGSRLPAYCTSMGRVLLADLPEADVRALIRKHPLVAHTSRTIVDVDRLCDELAKVRRQGWALIDQEREIGVRSIGAPIHDREGRVIAAVNTSVNAVKVDLQTMRGPYVRMLLEAANNIDMRLTSR